MRETYSVRLRYRDGNWITVFETDNQQAAEKCFNDETHPTDVYSFVQLRNNLTGVELRGMHLKSEEG